MRFNFAARLVFFSVALIVITVGLSSWFVYRAANDDLEESLADQLLAIALSTASLVDSEVVDLIYRTETDEISLPEEFEILRSQLDRVRTSNRLPRGENPIYIMRPSADYRSSGQLEFVVMPDADAEGDFFVGNLYPAEPHNRRALQGEPAVSRIYSDAEGSWISASAPLFDSRGKLVALVQVDHNVDHFSLLAWERTSEILRSALLAIAAGVALSVLFAKGMVRPLRVIAETVRAIGEGSLERRIELKRSDEIGDVAAGINRMARSLQVAREDAATAARALVTTGRLASVGELAAGVAHEINNPLSYVRANLAMLERDHVAAFDEAGNARGVSEASEDWVERVEMIREALEGVDQALAIVQDIKGFAHAGTDARNSVDLNEVVENAIRVAKLRAPAGVSLSSSYGVIPRVVCTGQELKQVFLNLILNAYQSLEDGGEIRVSTEFDDDHVVVCIEDDGIGIPREDQERIFDPFFTTKPVGEGTGLGLSISYQIVRRHRGELLVESEPGRGASFRVRLPVSDEGDEVCG